MAQLLRKLAPFRRTLSDAAFENLPHLYAMKGESMTYKEGLALVGAALTVGLGTVTWISWGFSGQLEGVTGQLEGVKGQLAGLEKGMNGQLEGVKGRLDGLTSRVDDLKAGQAQMLVDLSAMKAAVLGRG